eukprot:10864817-Karenia_brevis.AAC.1
MPAPARIQQHHPSTVPIMVLPFHDFFVFLCGVVEGGQTEKPKLFRSNIQICRFDLRMPKMKFIQ